MPPRPSDHPILQVFANIRFVNDAVQDAIAECLPEGMTVPQHEVRRLFDFRGDGLTPAEIAQSLHIPKSALTNTLQRLEANGFVRIEPCPEDGRKKQVWLTPAGRHTYVQSLAAIRPRMERLREAFTLEEFREALHFLKALHDWFEQKDWA